MLAVPQLVAPGTVESAPLLPSFLYFAHDSEPPLALPWDAGRRFAVGEHARRRASEAPARVVSSAKSWLSHLSIDRRAPVLPLGAPADVERISPVEASFRYLDHLGARFAVEVLERLGDRHGARFAPAKILVEHAREGKSFHR